MPTPNFVRLWQQAKAGDYSDHNQDPQSRGQITITKQETWMVLFDGFVTDGIRVATNADAIGAGLPVLGLVYNGLFCSGVRPRRSNDNPFLWQVDVNLATLQQQTSGGQTLWNLNLRKTTAAREVTRTHDRLGLPLCNTFGDLLPQMPNATLYDDVFALSWTTSLVPNVAFEDMKGKINADTFSFTLCGVTRSFAPSQAKCIAADFSTTKVITGTSGGTNQYSFVYSVEFGMQIRKPRWVWTAPNEGWRGFVDESGTIDTFRDGTPPITDQSTPRTSPTKMDLDGFELPNGSQIILLPDDVSGPTPAASRTYDDAGAFELEDLTTFSPLFALLHD